jgi:PEP-CTERM motif
MKKFLITATLAACAAATLSGSTITSFTYVNPQNSWSTDSASPYPIGVTVAGGTSNPFINPVNAATNLPFNPLSIPNGSYFLFFGGESFFPYYGGGGYNSRLTVGFSDGTFTTVYLPGEIASFFATSNPIPHDGDQSIILSSVGNTSVDRVGTFYTLEPNQVPDFILSFSNVPAGSTAPEPATGGMVVGTFGLLAWAWRKRARTVR